MFVFEEEKQLNHIGQHLTAVQFANQDLNPYLQGSVGVKIQIGFQVLIWIGL